MRKKIFLILFLTSPLMAENLSDIYRNGKIRFIEERRITDQNLPKEALFVMPIDLEIDSKGFLYICDARANNIKKFSEDGRFIKIIGRFGQGPGDLAFPMQICVTKDYLIVDEFFRNRRFSIFNLDGDFIKTIPFKKGETNFVHIESLPDGNLVAEIRDKRFSKQNQHEKFFLQISSPELKPIKTIFETDMEKTNWIVDNVEISIGSPYPCAPVWEVSPDGKLVIGLPKEYKIFIDPIKETKTAISRPFKPIKTSKKEKEKWFEMMRKGWKNKEAERLFDKIKKDIKFPEFKPVFDNILIDYEGNIWVHLYRENPDEEKVTFDVFSKDGKFINTVKILNGEYPYGAKMTRDGFWVKKEDEEGNIAFVKYRISEGR